jgi:hypothetical protein
VIPAEEEKEIPEAAGDTGLMMPGRLAEELALVPETKIRLLMPQN